MLRQIVSRKAVVARGNNARVALRRLLAEGRDLIESMVGHSVALQKDSAKLLMIGIQMLEIRRSNLPAWEGFVSGLKITSKADGSEYRDVIRVIFGQFDIELRGDGSLPRHTISRSQISRYGAALRASHARHLDGTKGPALARWVIESGGIKGIVAQDNRLLPDTRPSLRLLNRRGSPRFSVIVADPPWPYDQPSALVGNGGRGGNASHVVQVNVGRKYPAMALDQIKALPVPAADDCLLFLWVTNSFLADGSAADIVRSWGFQPETVLTWAKVQTDDVTPSMKTGHWFRSASEHVIFAVKGYVPRPPGYPALATWFPTRRLRHSVKPEVIHEYAEAACPQGPWLEMFARRPRKGWTIWGNERSGRT